MKTLKPFHIWYCEKCEKEMSHEEFLKHIIDEHKIVSKKAERTMIFHADGQKHYDYKYQWTIEGLIFTQHIRCMRDKSDMMY